MTIGNCFYSHGSPTFSYNSMKEIPNPLNEYLFRVSSACNWEGVQTVWKIEGIDQKNHQPMHVICEKDPLDHLYLAYSTVARLQEGLLHSAYVTCQTERFAEADRKYQADLAIQRQTRELRTQKYNAKRLDDTRSIFSIFSQLIFRPVQNWMHAPPASEEEKITKDQILNSGPMISSHPMLSIQNLPPHIQIFRKNLDEMDIRVVHAQTADTELLITCPIDDFISKFPLGCGRFRQLEAQQPQLDNEIISGIEKINQYLQEQGIFFQMPKVIRSLDETLFKWLDQPGEVARLSEADQELLRLFDYLEIPWRLQPEDLSECGPLIESLVEEVSSCQILSTWRFDKYALHQR